MSRGKEVFSNYSTKMFKIHLNGSVIYDGPFQVEAVQIGRNAKKNNTNSTVMFEETVTTVKKRIKEIHINKKARRN